MKLIALVLTTIAFSFSAYGEEPTWVPFKKGQTVTFPATKLRSFSTYILFKSGTSAHISESCIFRQFADINLTQLSGNAQFQVESVRIFDNRVRRQRGHGPKFIFLKDKSDEVSLKGADGLTAELVCFAYSDYRQQTEYSVADSEHMQRIGVRIEHSNHSNSPQLATGRN